MATYLIDSEVERIVDASHPSLPHDNLRTLLEELRKLELGFALFAFSGRNGAGACTCTGAKVGDKVIGIVNMTDGTTATASFEATITVENQIQQSAAGDLSTKKHAVLLVKKS